LLANWENQDRIIGPSLRRARHEVAVLCVIGVALSLPSKVSAGSARDYLNAPIDSWFALYNGGYAASVTPEVGLDVTVRMRTNAASQSVVLTRTMDYWGRTGGVSDIGFLWQFNILGGPALPRETFPNFVPQTFASFHLFVGTPLGEYEANRPLNPSTNR
jgi:hypothetical protein